MVKRIPYRLLAGILSVLLVLLSVPLRETGLALSAEAAGTEPDRYVVIVVDNSDTQQFLNSEGEVFFTADTALDDVKLGAQRLLAELEMHNSQKEGGHYYAALVSYTKTAYAYKEGAFTDEFEILINQIDSLRSIPSSRSITNGLNCANTCLEKITDEKALKSVVIFNTGMNDQGEHAETGRYSYATTGGHWYNLETGIHYYEYGNKAYEAADNLRKQGVLVYSVGLFRPMNEIPEYGHSAAEFTRMLAKDIATSPEYFIPVSDPSGLRYVVDEFQKKMMSNKYKGTFHFPSASERDFSASYYFDEGYFSSPATKYNPGLATMTLDFVLSAFNSNEVPATLDQNDPNSAYREKYKNAYALLRELDFEDIEESNYYKRKPEKDSMAVIAGHKDISYGDETFTLIAASTRGGNYESEWAGNFAVGTSGRHEGFNEAATKAKIFLSEYMIAHKDEFQDHVKLWIGGYSRGAATANLTAADITKAGGIGGITLDKDDIYAYCFEVPMGENTASVPMEECRALNNIHCIINPMDVVPKVAMSAWDFTAYGVYENVIPTPQTSREYAAQLEAMKKQYKALDTDFVRSSWFTRTESIEIENQSDRNEEDGITTIPEYDVQTREYVAFELFQGVDYSTKEAGLALLPILPIIGSILTLGQIETPTSMQSFLDQLVNSMAAGFQNREYYTETFQDLIRDFIYTLFSDPDANTKMEKFTKKATEGFTKKRSEITLLMLLGENKKLMNTCSAILLESLLEAGFDPSLSCRVGMTLRDAIDTLSRLLADLSEHTGTEALSTLIHNKDILFTTHYPELCLAWLQSQDPYYNGELREFNGSIYRIVRINCPVDVKIDGIYGTPIASIIDDVPQKIEDSTLITEVNANGEKLLYLPADGYYNIEIIARENCNVSVSIDEYSTELQRIVKITSFNDVAMGQGNKLNCVLRQIDETDPDYVINGSEVTYTLNRNGWLVDASSVKRGEEITNDFYQVNVAPEELYHGMILGGGTFVEDSFAQLTAEPFEGNEFVGWYENDELLSAETTYRFRVDKDREITAKFEGEPIDRTKNHFLTLAALDGTATAEPQQIFYQSGDQVSVKAEPSEGMKFVRWEAEDGVFADAASPETVFTMPDKDILIEAVFESENPEPETTAPAETTETTQTTTTTTDTTDTAQTTAMKGDVNNDGQLTVADAVLLCRVIAEDQSAVLSEQGKINADADGDGSLTSDDTTLILKALAGLLKQ